MVPESVIVPPLRPAPAVIDVTVPALLLNDPDTAEGVEKDPETPDFVANVVSTSVSV